MKTRKPGHSNLDLTVVGLGTWAQGGADWDIGRTMSQSRQLAAIMFTDIVGYTTNMGEDEQKALN